MSRRDTDLLPHEATARIALAYRGFADPCLATWLRGHIFFSAILFAVLFLEIFLVSLPPILFERFYFLTTSMADKISSI